MIEIPLTQGQVALIDDEDFELVSRHKWYARWSPDTKSFYALTKIRNPDGKRTTLLMHRLVMSAQPGQQVDHIHHLTLDNRKSELRLCTGSQNQHNQGVNSKNTSGYKGVYWQKRNQKWRSCIKVNGKRISLGLFLTPELAHAAYCRAALELHGDFARVA
ncbi:MAG: AP2 domain-containing protein [Acidithiobacillus sp.]